jgi:signal transduction histidine kinase
MGARMTRDDLPQKDVTNILTTLKEIAEAVIHAAEAGTLKQVFQRIAYVAQQMVHARYAALGIPDDDQAMLYFEVVGLTPDEIRQIGHPPVGRGLLGVIMQERQVLRLEHMREHPRSVGFPPHHPPMDRLLGVPVQAGEQLFGMLYLTDRLDGEPFSAEDQWLVESLAGYAALAIAGTSLSEQKERLALLEERERVGRELHDGIIQSLYAIGMQLQLLRIKQPTLGDDLSKATQNLDHVIEDIRSYILNLKIASYEQQTMHDCLANALARLHIPDTLALRLDAPHRQPPFAPPVVDAVCQIAYEAVSNIVRHAEATRASILVSEGDGVFEMVVTDNGRGISSDVSDAGGGLGLPNMMQRARIFGGELIISAADGGGTRVRLRLPTS